MDTETKTSPLVTDRIPLLGEMLVVDVPETVEVKSFIA